MLPIVHSATEMTPQNRTRMPLKVPNKVIRYVCVFELREVFVLQYPVCDVFHCVSNEIKAFADTFQQSSTLLETGYLTTRCIKVA